MKKIQIITVILAILFLNTFGFSQEDEKRIRKPLRFVSIQRALIVKGTTLENKSGHCCELCKCLVKADEGCLLEGLLC
jgi:hypothetical protein